MLFTMRIKVWLTLFLHLLQLALDKQEHDLFGTQGVVHTNNMYLHNIVEEATRPKVTQD